MPLPRSCLLSMCAAALCDVDVHGYPLQVPPWAETETWSQWPSPQFLVLLPKPWSGLMDAQRLAVFTNTAFNFFPSLLCQLNLKTRLCAWVLEQSPCHRNHPHILSPPSPWVSPSPKSLSLPSAQKIKISYLSQQSYQLIQTDSQGQQAKGVHVSAILASTHKLTDT